MENLFDHFNGFINEAARKSSKKGEDDVVAKGTVVINGKKQTGVDTDKLVGKKAQQASRGEFAVDEPTDDDLMKNLDMKAQTRNVKRLENCLKTETDFFIQGRAGWAKTSLIKKAAKRHGLTIVTVYLDKALATDLDGIPVPLQNEDGSVREGRALPAWADYIYQHPEKKFLLFFDEMNQAQPDVQNALMPIVLDHRICNIKFSNYFVGAAGNYSDENTACQDLSKPLMSRFMYFEWESGTEATWDDTINFLRKDWEPKLGKKAFDVITTECHKLFDNPRDMERYCLNWYWNLYQKGGNDWMDAEDVKDQITNKMLDQDATGFGKREYEEKVNKLCETLASYLQSGPEATATRKSSRKTKIATLDSETIALLKQLLEEGDFIADDGKHYACTQENWHKLIADGNGNDLTAEQIAYVNDNWDAFNVTVKYKTNAEAKKALPSDYIIIQ